MKALNPRDLPEKRQQFADWLKMPDSPYRYPPGIDTGELIYVTRDMCQLARAAARTLSPADVRLTAEDLPSDHMFLYFQDHKFTGAGNVVYVMTSGERAAMITAVSVELADAAIRLLRKSHGDWDDTIEDIRGVQSLMSPPPFMILGTAALPLNRTLEMPTEDRPDLAHLDRRQTFTSVKRMVALFRLIQQGNITEDEFAKPMKRFVDQAKKHRQPKPKSVRVISLMKPKRSSKSNGNGHTIAFRFLVRGHWRQQWYPSTGEHRPVWIKPHVRGPEDAPFVDTPKVYKA